MADKEHKFNREDFEKNKEKKIKEEEVDVHGLEIRVTTIEEYLEL